jgi:hypothetical protein
MRRWRRPGWRPASGFLTGPLSNYGSETSVSRAVAIVSAVVAFAAAVAGIRPIAPRARDRRRLLLAAPQAARPPSASPSPGRLRSGR